MSKRNRGESKGSSPDLSFKKLNAGPKESPKGSPKGSPKDNLLTISASFKFHDLNDDGVIDRQELLSYFKSDKMVAAIIERLDKNKDGVISYAGNHLPFAPTPTLTNSFPRILQ